MTIDEHHELVHALGEIVYTLAQRMDQSDETVARCVQDLEAWLGLETAEEPPSALYTHADPVLDPSLPVASGQPDSGQQGETLAVPTGHEPRGTGH